jgi:hypothetical protein
MTVAAVQGQSSLRAISGWEMDSASRAGAHFLGLGRARLGFARRTGRAALGSACTNEPQNNGNDNK